MPSLKVKDKLIRYSVSNGVLKTLVYDTTKDVKDEIDPNTSLKDERFFQGSHGTFPQIPLESITAIESQEILDAINRYHEHTYWQEYDEEGNENPPYNPFMKLTESKLEKYIKLLEKETGKKVTLREGKFERAVDFGNTFIKAHPEFKTEVRDYFQLMKDEVAEGGSVEHEISLFIGACEDLLKGDVEEATIITQGGKEVQMKPGETVDSYYEDAKDEFRVQDIKNKAGNDRYKALQLARLMAAKITTVDKAMNRYKAALNVFGQGSVAEVFLQRSKELGNPEATAIVNDRDAAEKAEREKRRAAALEKANAKADLFIKIIKKRYPELAPYKTTSSPVQYQTGNGTTVYVRMESTPRLQKGMSMGDRKEVSRQHGALRLAAEKLGGYYDYNYHKPYVSFDGTKLRESTTDTQDGKFSLTYDKDYKITKKVEKATGKEVPVKDGEVLDSYYESADKVLNEGTWALPKDNLTKEKMKAELKSLQNKWWNIIGDDTLYDGIDAAIRRINELPTKQETDNIMKESYDSPRDTKTNLIILKNAPTKGTMKIAQKILTQYETDNWPKESYASKDEWLNDVVDQWFDNYVNNVKK